jgi:hypothetical protein
MDIPQIIQAFAEKYCFIQNSDIEIVENSDFDVKSYLKLDTRIFISIDKNIISIGEIRIEIDSYDEQDWYTIDKVPYFRINIDDFPNKDSLVEAMVNQCKKNNLM